MQKLDRERKSPWDIFLGMHDDARRFQELVDTVGQYEMLKLAKRYNGIWYYVYILARIADGIDSGDIVLSPEMREQWTGIKASPGEVKA